MSSTKQPRVLLVEDKSALARVYTDYLRQEPYDLTHVETGGAALSFIEEKVPDGILLDLNLPDMNGIEILKRVTEQQLPTSVVVITAHGSVQTAVEAMRAGAFDFLVKPFNADRLVFTLRNAVERQRLARIVHVYEDDIARRQYCGFIGSSLAMQRVYRIIDSAAPSKATVFITGESGTGKEVCAEAIHRQSPRRDKPFIALNCGAIPRDLIESEIFGHLKGSFTGAVSDREGAASAANGGTLFLDEVCEMDFDLQTKLLRFVQTGTFQKVGGTKQEKVDVRFICATNREPYQEVEAGRFREDLYYRLHVIPIQLPPLREREDDVLAIARHFLVQFAKEEGRAFTSFEEDCEAVLRAFGWPGNVRQLQNVVRNIVVLNEGEVVTKDMLPPPLDSIGPAAAKRPTAAAAPPPTGDDDNGDTNGGADIRPLWLVEKDAIEKAIRLCDGNIPRAAAQLGVSASTVYRKRLAW